MRFIIYHSGYDSGDTQTYYDGSQPPGDDTTNHVDSLINSLRKAGVDAPSNGGNSPNVWAELGSVWRDCMGDPDQAAHLLGKLITWVGPQRIAWGTDSLWYGSPQPEIVALRRFEFTEEGKALYNLPHGLEGDAPIRGTRRDAGPHHPQRHPRPQRGGPTPSTPTHAQRHRLRRGGGAPRRLPDRRRHDARVGADGVEPAARRANAP